MKSLNRAPVKRNIPMQEMKFPYQKKKNWKENNQIRKKLSRIIYKKYLQIKILMMNMNLILTSIQKFKKTKKISHTRSEVVVVILISSIIQFCRESIIWKNKNRMIKISGWLSILNYNCSIEIKTNNRIVKIIIFTNQNLINSIGWKSNKKI